MIEIKRLSDADIEKLRNQKKSMGEHECPSCLLSNYNNGADVSCVTYVGLELVTCERIKKHACDLEMEARERDKMEDKKQLPTESELRAELEKKCKNINVVIDGLTAVVGSLNSTMHIAVSEVDGTSVWGKKYKFRPDIEPPAKYRSVFVRLSNGRTFIRVSGGKMSESGKYLMTICDAGEGNMMTYTNWCDCLDTSKHSAGWDMAWIEGVV